MKTNYKVALALVAGAAIGGAAIQGLHAQAKPPAYYVVDISDVTDPDGYKVLSQRPPAVAAAGMQEFGGRFLARTDKITTLDGTAPKRFVIITFDDVEKANAFNNSTNQKEVNAIRIKTTKSRSFIVEGM